MSPALLLRLALRESRGATRTFVFFVACLSIGVAAVVAVAAIADGIDEGIRAQARKLLAADLVVRASHPLPAEVEQVLAGEAEVERVVVKEMVTMAAAPPRDGMPGPSLLVELKAVGGAYPFYGDLVLEPGVPLATLLAPDTVVVAPDVLARLKLAVGDSIRIGTAELRVAGVIRGEPDSIGGAFRLGPRVLISLDGLAGSGLEALGSRIRHQLLLREPEGSGPAVAEATASRLRRALRTMPEVRVETWAEAEPGLRDGIRRVSRYLALAALLSLLIGGIGVAGTVRAWLRTRIDSIAVLRCIGLRPREVMALYMVQAAALGMAGSLVGAVLGTGLQWTLPVLLGDVLPGVPVKLWQPAALTQGMALGLGVALLFAFPALWEVRRVPPARVLRRDLEPQTAGRWTRIVTGAVVALGVLVTAWIEARSLPQATAFTAGLLVLTGLLSLSARLLMRAAAAVPRGRVRFAFRHGLAALGRPAAGTAGSVTAIGLGVLVVVTMALVEWHLENRFAAEIPTGSPSAFLVDIQPAQWEGVKRLLADEGAEQMRSVPVVMARLKSIDGRTVAGMAEGREGGQRWALTREQRLTYLSELPAGNEVVAGSLWSDPASAEVSLEVGFAKDLGVGLGAKLGFDVQGVPVELKVTSLRRVDWGTYGINFFVISEPGVLDQAPQTRLATARLPAGREAVVQDRLAAGFPNVTLFQTRALLDKVAGILRRLALGVRVLGSFTVLTGIAILAGAVGAGAARRGREVALLKTLGFTRAGVVAAFATEYALVGVVAGFVGGIAGCVLSGVVVTRLLDLHFVYGMLPGALAVAVAGATLLTVASGLAASRSALRRRPIEVLRGE